MPLRSIMSGESRRGSITGREWYARTDEGTQGHAGCGSEANCRERLIRVALARIGTAVKCAQLIVRCHAGIRPLAWPVGTTDTEKPYRSPGWAVIRRSEPARLEPAQHTENETFVTFQAQLATPLTMPASLGVRPSGLMKAMRAHQRTERNRAGTPL